MVAPVAREWTFSGGVYCPRISEQRAISDGSRAVADGESNRSRGSHLPLRTKRARARDASRSLHLHPIHPTHAIAFHFISLICYSCTY